MARTGAASRSNWLAIGFTLFLISCLRLPPASNRAMAGGDSGQSRRIFRLLVATPYYMEIGSHQQQVTPIELARRRVGNSVHLQRSIVSFERSHQLGALQPGSAQTQQTVTQPQPIM